MTNGTDGRRRPPTDGLPRTQPMSPMQVRQNAAAKRMLRRLVQGENPPTAPMSIVDRLAGSPYANPMIQVGGVDTSARKTIDFALHLAEVHVPVRCRRPGGGDQHHRHHRRPGAEEHRSGHHQPVGGHQLRPQGPDAHHTAAGRAVLDQQLRRPGQGAPAGHGHRGRGSGPRGGRAPARRDHPSPKPFPRWMVTVAFGVFSAVFVGVLGGGPGASAVAFCLQPAGQPAGPAAGAGGAHRTSSSPRRARSW